MKWPFERRPYKVQAAALAKALGEPGFAYFLEMGLGKTAVALAEYKIGLDAGVYQNMAVLCPNSLKSNWKKEANELGLGVPVYTWVKNKFDEPPAKGPGLFLMNYEALIHSGPAALGVVMREPTYLVLDESVCIKNFNAKSTKQALSLSTMSAANRILTGKPRVQSVMDLWSQLRFIGLIRGMNPYQFRNRFAVMGGFMAKVVTGSKNEDELRELMDPASFVAFKSDWTDLPPKLPPVTRQITMAEPQRRHYAAMEKDFVTDVNENKISAPMVISALMKLQQISSGFIFDEEGKAHRLVPVGSNPKIAEVLSIMEQTIGKTIIFAHFRPSVDMLVEALRPYNPVCLRGGMKDEQIDATKMMFNEDSSCRAIVCQDNASKYGHTLLGRPGVDRCATVVFYENTYSLDTRSQAEDRPHRHGQDSPVSYIDLACSKTDLKAITSLQRKENVATAFLRSLDRQ